MTTAVDVCGGSGAAHPNRRLETEALTRPPLTATVRRGAERVPLKTLVAWAYIVHSTRGRVRLLMLVRCSCGSMHQHTSSRLDFAEGRRTGGCGRRYVVRVGAVRGEAA